MKLRLVGVIAFAISIFCAGISLAHTKKTLTNQDVIDMSKAGLDERTIRKAIETSECTFDTSAQTLIFLKNAGISESILNAMLVGGAPKPRTGAWPTEVGIYSMKDGTPTEMGAEVANFRTGGVGKMILTDGIDQGHVNGQIKGPHSKTRAISPLEFIIVTFEGVTPSEYVLVKLDEKNDRREFRQTTGGVIHASSGAEKNSLDFDAVKLAPRTYRVKLEGLAAGEYGFLPPIGPANQSASGSGRICSFSFLE